MSNNRSTLGKRSKNKGNNYERTLANKFKEAYQEDLVRTPQSGGFARTREASDFRGDIVSVEAGVELLLHIEAKNQKTLVPHKWIEQALSDCPEGKIPVVIFHEHGTSNDYVLINHLTLINLIGDNPFFTLYHSEKNWRLMSWYQQAKKNNPQPRWKSVVVCAKDEKNYALIHLDDFFSLVPKYSVIRRDSL